jgi:hypothetical protein
MPENQLSGWFKVAVKIDAVTELMEAMRGMGLGAGNWKPF